MAIPEAIPARGIAGVVFVEQRMVASLPAAGGRLHKSRPDQIRLALLLSVFFIPSWEGL